MSRFYKYIKESYKYPKLLEGGGYGHLANIFDNDDFTFSELENVIKDSLSGNLEYINLKTDGQNLMFTWKNNQLLFARNKSHLKNYGENAMTTAELSKKFSGRGTLSDAFNFAARDLYEAISKLSEKQKQKIFKDGKKFMSVEVMYTENENIVHYGVNELRFHGTKEYDEKGNEIGDNKQDADLLANMIKQIRKNKQTTYDIKSLEVVNLPKIPDFDKESNRLIKKLNELRKKYKLSKNSTILDYKREYFKGVMKSKGLSIDKKLIQRWAEMNKSYTLREIKKDYNSDDYKKIKDIEDNIKDHYKNALLPVEKIILDLGATVLKNVSNFMVLNPEKSKQTMRKKLEDAIKQIKSKGTPEMINKLQMELERLEAAGGIDLVTPEEGITFMYKGGFYKLTGQFAPYNKIINMLWKL